MTLNVEDNYTRGGLQQKVLEAIVAAGFDPDDLDAEALAPAEEFHTFGRSATVDLAEADVDHIRGSCDRRRQRTGRTGALSGWRTALPRRRRGPHPGAL